MARNLLIEIRALASVLELQMLHSGLFALNLLLEKRIAR